ncbi:MAG: MBL fold metallo-hydrolase [Candidatus Pacebacteria bacterium]|nr:MBL fold metallo-hydrolase [Candidatus Paceibacterota bacterium]
MQIKVKIGIVFLILIGIANFCLWQFILNYKQVSESIVEVNFFDVGEGDSILIEMPNSNQIIIDGGLSQDVVSKIAKEMPFFDRKIEMIILTHPDKDHVTGLFEVFDVFEVEKVLMPEIKGKEEKKELYVNFKEAVREEGSKIIFAKQGQKISFPGEVYFLIFWPAKDFFSSDINDFSIVGKLIFEETSFLFTGDISDKIEEKLILDNFLLKSDILKVAHHGSKYSTSDKFLAEIIPGVAVISVGKNSYGHPTREVLERLEKYDIKTLRTDKNKDIKIISNGKNYGFSDF